MQSLTQLVPFVKYTVTILRADGRADFDGVVVVIKGSHNCLLFCRMIPHHHFFLTQLWFSVLFFVIFPFSWVGKSFGVNSNANLAYNNNIIIKVKGLFILKFCNHKTKEGIASIANKCQGWPTNSSGWPNKESCSLWIIFSYYLKCCLAWLTH